MCCYGDGEVVSEGEDVDWLGDVILFVVLVVVFVDCEGYCGCCCVVVLELVVVVICLIC